MILRLLHSHIVSIRSFLTVVLMSVCGCVWAQTEHSADSLRVLLSRATTPDDSVAILHNLYDCYYFNDRKPILYEIFETAEHAKDYDAMLEVLFVLGSIFQHDLDLEKELLQMAERVPESELQKLHVLYIKLRYQANRLNRVSEAERQQRLHQALKKYREHNRLNKSDRIAYLFLICTNLHYTTDSELLIHYLQQLNDMIDEFPPEELAIRSLFYNLAINIYIGNEMYDKALVANKNLLGIVHKFDSIHESQGRIFRNYDGSLYQNYHNMLVCAEELPDEEIDMYYDQILKITARNPRIKSDLGQQNRTYIYYLMAKKRYAEALPKLKDQLKVNTNQTQHNHFALMLEKAARETGDKEALLYSQKILNSIYRDRLLAKSDISLSELQTIYDVENLKDQNRDLIVENRRMEIDRKHQSIVAVTVAVVILIGLLIWMVRLYIYSRRLAKRLSATNKQLTDESSSLKEMSAKLVDILNKVKAADRVKNDFVENVNSEIREPLGAIVSYSHIIADCAKDDDRAYLREYADTMCVNTDLLVRLVNDILDLPKIESGELSIQRSPTSVKAICNFALELVKKHVDPDVKIVFANDGQPDTTILTDPQRVEQVLIQLLTNAAKFTPSGSITFGYEISRQHDTITFTVTDTGIGIPEGMEEKIFDRFVKIDPTAQGNGLGLYISRLLANMLGGSLHLDSSYRGGARFVLTIPIS